MNFYKFCEDEAAVKVYVEGTPIHKFFSPAEFLKFGLEAGSPGEGKPWAQMVDLPIAEFLGLAEPIPEDDLKRHAPQDEFKKDVLAGKSMNWDIPYLMVAENEDGVWKVVGHDGRHRGMLLQSLGYDTMPVRIELTKGTLNEELLPDTIWCQNDKNVKRERDHWPFPITEDNFETPYCEVAGDRVLVGSGKGPKSAIVEDATAYEAVDRVEGDDDGVFTGDGEFRGKAPESCVQAKKNFKKNQVPNLAYRKDNYMPASNLREYMAKYRP